MSSPLAIVHLDTRISFDPASPRDLAWLVEQSVDGFDEFLGMWHVGVTVKCVGIPSRPSE